MIKKRKQQNKIISETKNERAGKYRQTEKTTTKKRSENDQRKNDNFNSNYWACAG